MYAKPYHLLCLSKMLTKKYLSFVCIRNWPLPIGAFQDQCIQTMVNEHN